MRCNQSMHLFVQTLKSDNQTKLFQATRWLRSFPLLCLCDLRLNQSSGCCSAANASDLLMIVIVELILLLSCGDCCGGGNYATAKGGSLATQGNQSRYAWVGQSWLLCFSSPRLKFLSQGHFLEVPPSWIQTTLKEDQLWLPSS